MPGNYADYLASIGWADTPAIDLNNPPYDMTLDDSSEAGGCGESVETEDDNA